VAFLVTTGVDDVDVGVEAMRSGADDYLVKPLLESLTASFWKRRFPKRNLGNAFIIFFQDSVAHTLPRFGQSMVLEDHGK
jgi:DNA-binding NtrC family response regulator